MKRFQVFPIRLFLHVPETGRSEDGARQSVHCTLWVAIQNHVTAHGLVFLGWVFIRVNCFILTYDALLCFHRHGLFLGFASFPIRL